MDEFILSNMFVLLAFLAAESSHLTLSVQGSTRLTAAIVCGYVTEFWWRRKRLG